MVSRGFHSDYADVHFDFCGVNALQGLGAPLNRSRACALPEWRLESARTLGDRDTDACHSLLPLLEGFRTPAPVPALTVATGRHSKPFTIPDMAAVGEGHANTDVMMGLFLAPTSLASYTWTEVSRLFEPIGVDRWLFERTTGAQIQATARPWRRDHPQPPQKSSAQARARCCTHAACQAIRQSVIP
jgi:hypothetical protein